MYSGFEFRQAEMASADAKGIREIEFDYGNRYVFWVAESRDPQGISEHGRAAA